MSKFIIYGTPRSGTTLLVSLLDDHPAVFCVGEALKKRHANIRHAEYAYEVYRRRNLVSRIRDIVSRRGLLEDYLDFLYGRPGYEAVGFKFHHVHGRRFPTIVDYFREHDVRVVRIKRRNLLKKHVSAVTARARNVYATDRELEVFKVSLDTDTLVGDLDALAREEDEIERTVAGLATTTVVYEDLCADFEAAGSKVLRFLGVSDHERTLATPIKKINPDDLASIVENYDAVRRVLEGTAYEAFLS